MSLMSMFLLWFVSSYFIQGVTNAFFNTRTRSWVQVLQFLPSYAREGLGRVVRSNFKIIFSIFFEFDLDTCPYVYACVSSLSAFFLAYTRCTQAKSFKGNGNIYINIFAIAKLTLALSHIHAKLSFSLLFFSSAWESWIEWQVQRTK